MRKKKCTIYNLCLAAGVLELSGSLNNKAFQFPWVQWLYMIYVMFSLLGFNTAHIIIWLSECISDIAERAVCGSHCRPFTPDVRSHKQEPGETHTRTPPHNSAECSICPNKQHMLFVFYNKHSVTESSGNTNTARSPARMTEEGKKKEEATSSVRDVRDKSQIRSESEFPLRSRPFNPQLRPFRHMTYSFRGREDADAAKTVKLLFVSLAAVTLCSRLKE